MLTTNQIEALQPGPKRQIFAIGDGSGLSLRVEVNGKKKWVARRDGKLRTLGDWPDLGIREAKAAASEAIAYPTSFADVWTDWYTTEVEPRQKRPENARNDMDADTAPPEVQDAEPHASELQTRQGRSGTVRRQSEQTA